MSSVLVFNRVYRLEIQSVMLLYSLWFTCPPPPSQSQSLVYYTDRVCLERGGGGDVELCWRPHSARV
jgi:hypothetical protein